MPVFSSHLVDYKGLEVGKRIRDERRRKGLTLRRLAERMGLSEATLSNIETDKVSLDLTELGRIASALEVPVATFLPRSHMSHYLVKRANEVANEPLVSRKLAGPEPGPPIHHNAGRPLAGLFVGKQMEPLLAEIRALPDKDLHFIGHDHEEFMFVLRGEVEMILKTNEGLVTERLGPGDCVYFRSNLPHCHRGIGPRPAETIDISYSLRGPIDPDDSEIGSFGRRFYRRGVYADATREAGEKIGLLRRSHGITVAELAREMELGVRLLAKIERGDRAPNLDLLSRLARRFRRPIEYFFATTLESQPYYSIQRASQIKALVGLHRKHPTLRDTQVFRPLALEFAGRGLHPYYVQFVAAAGSDHALHEHHGQEFIYVLEGELEFVTAEGEKSELLHPGDSIFLDSSVPHSFRDHSRNPFASANAEILAVFWSPLGVEYLFDEPDTTPTAAGESAARGSRTTRKRGSDRAAPTSAAVKSN